MSRYDGWTRQQWIDDARRIMNDPIDGCSAALVNGHVMAMLEVLDGGDPTIRRDDFEARTREARAREARARNDWLDEDAGYP